MEDKDSNLQAGFGLFSFTGLSKVPPIKKKVGKLRNDFCPCGSKKKYKNCCMNKSTISKFLARMEGWMYLLV